jgi:predicted ester cyclase
MAPEDLRTKVQQAFNEAFKGNVNALDEVTSQDILFHRPPGPDVKGLAAYKQGVEGLRKSFSDIEFTFDDFMIEGNKAACRWTFKGTHTGLMPDMPIPPTGKRVTMTGLTLVHMVNGKSSEEWEYGDMLGVMQQLGVAPSGPSK